MKEDAILLLPPTWTLLKVYNNLVVVWNLFIWFENVLSNLWVNIFDKMTWQSFTLMTESFELDDLKIYLVT